MDLYFIVNTFVIVVIALLMAIICFRFGSWYQRIKYEEFVLFEVEEDIFRKECFKIFEAGISTKNEMQTMSIVGGENTDKLKKINFNAAFIRMRKNMDNEKEKSLN